MAPFFPRRVTPALVFFSELVDLFSEPDADPAPLQPPISRLFFLSPVHNNFPRLGLRRYGCLLLAGSWDFLAPV